MAIDHNPLGLAGKSGGQATAVDGLTSPNSPAPSFLSKSKYLQGLQCAKLLWHAINAKHLIPAPDESAQALFDQGAEVGALARTLYPTGVQIGPGNLQERLEATRSREHSPGRNVQRKAVAGQS